MALVPIYERRNVLTGQAQCWMRKLVYPTDYTTPPVIPADTLALGAAWPSPWVAIGATQDGLQFGFQRQRQDIMIEEQVNPVDVRTKSLRFEMQLDLSEDTLATMQIAYGGGNITTAVAAATTYGYSELVISDEMQDYGFGFEGENQYGMARRCVVPVVKSVGNIKTKYRRAAQQRLYSITLESLTPLSSVKIRDLTAEPTGP